MLRILQEKEQAVSGISIDDKEKEQRFTAEVKEYLRTMASKTDDESGAESRSVMHHKR